MGPVGADLALVVTRCLVQSHSGRRDSGGKGVGALVLVVACYFGADYCCNTCGLLLL